MRILITGATGFVGKTLIPYLFSKGVNDLVLLVRNLDKAKTLFGNESVEMITTQSSDWMEQVKNANPDVTLHLAAFFTGRHDNENVNKLVEANILFTTFLLEALSNTQCQNFINIGTFSEFRYGNGEFHPNNLYSATKRQNVQSSDIINLFLSGIGLMLLSILLMVDIMPIRR